MHRNSVKIEASMEAQRAQAQQASREQQELDPRSVLLKVEYLLAENRVAEARAIVSAWKAGQL
jgi:hypothetical protein